MQDFSNVLKKSLIEKLAESDENEVVREVQEYFGDYFAVNPDLFTLNLYNCLGDKFQPWNMACFSRSADGLMALLLSLKKKPIVRYDRNSGMANRLAQEVQVSFT